MKKRLWTVATGLAAVAALVAVPAAMAAYTSPKLEDPPGSHRFVVPETTLGALAAEVARRTGARALRVVGDPAARIRRVRRGHHPAGHPDRDIRIVGGTIPRAPRRADREGGSTFRRWRRAMRAQQPANQAGPWRIAAMTRLGD